MYFFFLRLGRSPRSWGLTLIWLLRNGAVSNPSPARTASSVAGPGDALYWWTPRMHALVNICVRNSYVRETQRLVYVHNTHRLGGQKPSDLMWRTDDALKAILILGTFFILSLLSHLETKLVVASLHNRLQALCHQGTFFWRTTYENISFLWRYCLPADDTIWSSFVAYLVFWILLRARIPGVYSTLQYIKNIMEWKVDRSWNPM